MVSTVGKDNEYTLRFIEIITIHGRLEGDRVERSTRGKWTRRGVLEVEDPAGYLVRRLPEKLFHSSGTRIVWECSENIDESLRRVLREKLSRSDVIYLFVKVTSNYVHVMYTITKKIPQGKLKINVINTHFLPSIFPISQWRFNIRYVQLFRKPQFDFIIIIY